MEVKGNQRYPFTVEKVFEIFSNPKHVEEKQRFLGSRNISIENCSADSSTLKLTVSRDIPAEAPSVLKKFIAEWNQVTQDDHWQGDAENGYNGSMKLDIKGVPVSIKGRLALKPDGDGCLHEVTLDVSCGIPLVGKKLADFVAGKSRETMNNEFAFIENYLKENA